MRNNLLSLIVGLAVLGGSQVGAGAVTIPTCASEAAVSACYDVSIFNVFGNIATDGKIGVLSSADILDWNLSIIGFGTPITLTGPLSGNNSFLTLTGSALSTMAFPPMNALLWDANLVPGTFEIQSYPGAPTESFALGVDLANAENTYSVVVTEPSVTCPMFYPCVMLAPDTISVTFDYGGTILGLNTTPLPAALPLFATGLGALGLLGWRRKRKNAVQHDLRSQVVCVQ